MEGAGGGGGGRGCLCLSISGHASAHAHTHTSTSTHTPHARTHTHTHAHAHEDRWTSIGTYRYMSAGGDLGACVSALVGTGYISACPRTGARMHACTQLQLRFRARNQRPFLPLSCPALRDGKARLVCVSEYTVVCPGRGSCVVWLRNFVHQECFTVSRKLMPYSSKAAFSCTPEAAVSRQA